MKNKLFFALAFTFLSITQFVNVANALEIKQTSKYFNGPTISNISTSSAFISLSPVVLKDIKDEEISGIYFEYYETQQVCIMIYPTPENCLPKKTIMGRTSSILTNLKPNTSYTVKYKRDNTIRCITTPCPGNEFESLSVEFKTLSENNNNIFSRNLKFGMKNQDVVNLQKILVEQGYLNSNITGFFGSLTRQAVINYQKMNNILATGIVGPLTRATFIPAKGEYFEGKISAFSTACFADGICSVTVDGKTVVITRGWARGIVGSLQGVESIGDIENKIGSNAKVYAAKTEDGFTLYGNKNFYLKVE